MVGAAQRNAALRLQFAAWCAYALVWSALLVVDLKLREPANLLAGGITHPVLVWALALANFAVFAALLTRGTAQIRNRLSRIAVISLHLAAGVLATFYTLLWYGTAVLGDTL